MSEYELVVMVTRQLLDHPRRPHLSSLSVRWVAANVKNLTDDRLIIEVGTPGLSADTEIRATKSISGRQVMDLIGMSMWSLFDDAFTELFEEMAKRR